MSLDNFINQFGGWTELYEFYNRTIQLRYDPKDHVYLLVVGDDLIPQDGVTTVCHIIDKSEPLMAWAVKIMAQKILNTISTMLLPTGDKVIPQTAYEEFEKLILDAKNAHKEKVEEAADIGKEAHSWIEQYIKSVLSNNEAKKLELLAKFPENEKARNCCIAAIQWMANHNVRWISTERKIYSRTYQYAGTMDGLALVDSCNDLLCCPHCFKDRLSVIDWKSSNYLYLEYLFQTAAYEFAHEEEFGVDIKDRWVIRLGKDDGEFDPWHLEEDSFDQDFAGFLIALALHRSVRSVKNRLKAKAEFVRAERKVRDKAAKESAYRIRCPKADDYKGTRKSKCLSDGTQCQACKKIYADIQAQKVNSL